MVRPPEPRPGFSVDLPVFQGPFDLLLQLIARRELDVTEVALSQVTDEFIAYIAASPDLSVTTEFIVIAATLLEMKAASLLPRTEAETEALDQDLSARDLLFSRLLQYRAFKQMGELLGQQMGAEAKMYYRDVALEPQFKSLRPELKWDVTPALLAAVAGALLAEKPSPDLAEHVARPRVSVEEQTQYIEGRLRKDRKLAFTDLIEGEKDLGIVVGRFLALLELFRRGALRFIQPGPLQPLVIVAEGEHEHQS